MTQYKNIPYILVVNSKEDKNIVAGQLKKYFDETKSHYVVVMDETGYGKTIKDFEWISKTFFKLPKFNKLKKQARKAEPKKSKGMSKRIANACMRFDPVAVVCPTAYGLLAAAESKKQNEFEAPIVSLIPDFTFDKNICDSAVDYYIVESEELKDSFVSGVIPASCVLPLGVPVSGYKINDDEKRQLKEKLGLKDNPTVFVCAVDGKESLEALDMLFDQGDIINIVVYVENKKLQNKLRKKVEFKGCDNVQLFDKLSLYNDYLNVSDILITNYDAATIAKAFASFKASIAFAPKSDVQKADVEYLTQNELIAYAPTPADVIIKLYDLLQTDLQKKLVSNISKRLKPDQLKDICAFLASLTPSASE